MNADFDLRDYARGVKRLAKDFRRALRLAVETSNIETTKLFDDRFRADIQAVLRELSYGYESVNAIGLHRSVSKPQHLEQAFFLFHEALNLVLVAVRTVRGGSVVASDGVLRQALELACVAYQIASDSSAKILSQFLAGELHAPRAIAPAKKVYAPIGKLYGVLSSSSVHASTEHIRNSIASDVGRGAEGRINVGASFAPSQASRFKLGLIRIERVAVAVAALIEAAFADYVEQPRFWKKTTSGLEWSSDPYIEKRLRGADIEQKAIEEPFQMVYPWAESTDKEEVRRLLGTTEGNELANVERLNALTQNYPGSFVIRYLLGAALYYRGDFRRAATEFEQAWNLRPDAYDVWCRLEAIYRSYSDPQVLEDFYRRSLKRDSNDYVTVHNLGMLLVRMSRLEEALECFQRAHELQPERYWAVYNAANTLLQLGRFHDAIDCYHHAAERDPNSPDPWHSGGVAHVRAGELREAYKSFRRAVQLDPGYFASWANLASVCRELGMRLRALCCARRAQRLAPGDGRMAALVSELEGESPPAKS
ncbi:MAG: tetratricopeptide repeat protein [Terriglobia bacterium]